MMHFFRSFVLIVGMLLASTTLLSAQSESKYSYFPKNIYKNQIFPVTVIVFDAQNSENITFSFDSSSAVQPISNKPLVIQNGSESFYTFYFKAANSDIHIPELQIRSEIRHTVLPSAIIPIKALQPRKDFCGVLAAEMIVKNSQVSNYDEHNLIVTLNLEANEANLENMELSSLQESGIEDVKRENAKVYGDFYAIVPNSQKVLKFTYYNTIKNQYNYLEVPVEIKDATIAAHSELNPQDDNFEELKKFLLFSLSGFFFLMFLFKRDFFFLVLGAVSFITLLTLYIPNKKICVRQGAPLFILPTHTSTVGAYADKEFQAMILGERDIYIKVETMQGIVGWVKNEDLCEN